MDADHQYRQYGVNLVNVALEWFKNQNTLTKSIFALCTFLSARYLFIKSYRKYKRLPPGPIGIPFLGCGLQLAIKEHEYWIDANVSKISSIPLLMSDVLCINDMKVAKILLGKSETLWRPKGMWKAIDASNLCDSHGDVWFETRKLSQSQLVTRMNKSFLTKHVNILLNEIVYKELNECIENDKLWICDETLKLVTFNNMYSCVFGDLILDRNDAVYLRFVKAMEDNGVIAQNSIFSYLAFGEWFNNLFRVKSYTKSNIDLRSCISIWCAKAHKKYNENGLESYYDFLYNELSNRTENQNKLYREIINNDVLGGIQAMIYGGTDTTATTLTNGILFAAKNSAIQSELFAELDKNKSLDVLKDLKEFDKLRAFVHEILRFVPVGPIGIPRSISKKGGLHMKLDDDNEYILPDKSVLLLNIIGIQRDPKMWTNPNKFDIKRWLDDNGKFTKKGKQFIAFSYGQRNCPGETLAMKSLYLVFANLFRLYRFYFDNPEKVKMSFHLDLILHVNPMIGVKVEKRE